MKDLIQGIVTKFYEAIIITLIVFLFLALCWGGFKTWQSSHYKTKFENADAKHQLALNEEKQKHIDDLAEIQRMQNESMQDILVAVNAAGMNYETFRIEHEKATETINNKLQTVVNDALYKSICFNAGGVHLANEAKNGSGSAKPP
ncbi:hypothetical protein [Acinetobacter variabilis]|uniref:hypothetical protein n=1 Tax=Acinetobacter variabilis TaxID=70346 RepID=UPI00289ABB91|nr:hypothetical protein [Acinetobacter variabilis]